MAKYEVIRPWHGVTIGDVVEFENLHPALKPNVRLMRGTAAGELTVASPGADTKSRKEVIAARLKELDIEFKGNLGADKLAELLPKGELDKLFPAE